MTSRFGWGVLAGVRAVTPLCMAGRHCCAVAREVLGLAGAHCPASNLSPGLGRKVLLTLRAKKSLEVLRVTSQSPSDVGGARAAFPRRPCTLPLLCSLLFPPSLPGFFPPFLSPFYLPSLLPLFSWFGVQPGIPPPVLQGRGSSSALRTERILYK